MTQDPQQSWPPQEPDPAGPAGGAASRPAPDPYAAGAPNDFPQPYPTAFPEGSAPSAYPVRAHRQSPYPQSPYPQAPYPPAPYPQGPSTQAPYLQGQHPQGPYGWRPAPPTNGMAIASVVLGILWLFWVGSALALVFGYVGRNQIRQTGEGGDGLAIAGIVLGWIGIGLLVLSFGLAAVSPT